MKKSFLFVWLMSFLLLSACAIDPKIHQKGVIIDDVSTSERKAAQKPKEEVSIPASRSQVIKPELSKTEEVKPEALSKPLDKEYLAMLNQKKQYIAPNSAIASLLATAERQQKQGELGAAASTLERALRIEPRNSLLWHQFASVRYQQKDYPQALQMAGKSNSYAKSDKQMQINNWQIIGHVKELQGDQAGAQAAFAKVAGLSGGR